jgi:hypothetical protein
VSFHRAPVFLSATRHQHHPSLTKPSRAQIWKEPLYKEHLTGLHEPHPTHQSTATPSSRRRQTAALVSHCAKLLSSTFRCCHTTLTPPMCAGSHQSAPIPPRQLPLSERHISSVSAALRFTIVAGCELVCKTFLGNRAVTPGCSLCMTWARVVLGWVTSWEVIVLHPFFRSSV